MASLVPELYCRDIAISTAFYTEVLGFETKYERPEHRFVYLALGAAELMLEQPTDPTRTWITGPLEVPFGRGMNLEIFVPDIEPILARLAARPWPLWLPVEERWYRRGDHELGNRQFVVQDPDGYLLRLCVDLGVRARESHTEGRAPGPGATA